MSDEQQESYFDVAREFAGLVVLCVLLAIFLCVLSGVHFERFL